MRALQLGASLYAPATRGDLVALGNRHKYPGLRSLIYCTEDAVRPEDVPAAVRNLEAALPRLEPAGVLRFARVRHPGLLRRLLQADGVRNLDGFVLPKVTRYNIDEYLGAFSPDDGFAVMLTLETAEAFDPAEMRGLLAALLRPGVRDRVLSLRVGGNDLLQLLGLRRPRGGTVYATPLGPGIAALVAAFRPHGFNLTAPVFERLDRPRLLAREVRRDLAVGLFGKTAVHPSQVAVIENGYRVRADDLAAAERVLEAAAPAVFRHDGAMCEPATHRAWAAAVVERARLYGVRPVAAGRRHA